MEYSLNYNQRPKIVLPGVSKIITEFLDNIYYCQADDNYTHLYLEEGDYRLVTGNLKDLEDILKPYQFIRCHRSYIVNCQYIREILKKRNELVLLNNAYIPISEKYRQDLLNYLYDHSVHLLNR